MTTPKMKSVFLVERADTSTPAFQAWFGKSKVVDSSGQPAVVYHGTKSPGDFQVFRQANDLGHHFGTSQAAHTRMSDLGWDPELPDDNNWRVIPVFLSIQRPIVMEDMKSWEPSEIAKRLRDSGTFTEQEYLSIASRANKAAAAGPLISLLKKKGFDGIEYINSVEDKGSTSWIAFDPGQIKSVFNRGTWDKRRGSISE